MVGTTRVQTDGNGVVVAWFDYEAFGEVSQQVGSAAADELHHFTGKPIDGTGLYYFNVRYMDPEIGRFISRDPAMDGANWYVYCNNNSVNHVDMMGLADNPLYIVVLHGVMNGLGTATGTLMGAVAGGLGGGGLGLAGEPIGATVGTGVGYESSEAAFNIANAKLSNKSSKNTPNRGMNNNRVMEETKIKGLDVSMDVEIGGSQEVNIHLKVNGDKYIFNAEKGEFLLEKVGNKLPNSLRGNRQIVDSLNKAKKLAKSWDGN
jgi:RHS repeat-associated protein